MAHGIESGRIDVPEKALNFAGNHALIIAQTAAAYFLYLADIIANRRCFSKPPQLAGKPPDPKRGSEPPRIRNRGGDLADTPLSAQTFAYVFSDEYTITITGLQAKPLLLIRKEEKPEPITSKEKEATAKAGVFAKDGVHLYRMSWPRIPALIKGGAVFEVRQDERTGETTVARSRIRNWGLMKNG